MFSRNTVPRNGVAPPTLPLRGFASTRTVQRSPAFRAKCLVASAKAAGEMAKYDLLVKECNMRAVLRQVWGNDEGQDIAEYAVMLAVILVLVVGTVRLIGSNSNTVFSQAASSIQ